MTATNVTPRQAQYFASMAASLQRDTGKTLDAWVAIARTCPETGHRARLKWFKATHGLLQNRASYVLDAAFPSGLDWTDAQGLIDALWNDPAARVLYEAVDAVAMALPGAIRTARKDYTAWSRTFQFAALRPAKGGTVMLGLAIAPDTDARLEAPRSESWSERLKTRTPLGSIADMDDQIAAWLRGAWEKA